jgi:LmbE family N-acetylglucosaminyl deacetylase
VEQDLKGRAVVISPHLDDAVLSLGAAIARSTKLGADVAVVTVFAGDPGSTTSAGPWDRGCGFRSAGEAASVLRREDQRACSVLGARPVWLPFRGMQYESSRDAARVWAALEPLVERANILLLPGFPLTHPDHAWVTELILGTARRSTHIGFYAEQPYARQSSKMPTPSHGQGLVAEQPLRWVTLPAGNAERLAKGRACRAYWSQFRGFRCHLSRRLLLPEVFWTDERLGQPDATVSTIKLFFYMKRDQR